MALNAVNSFFFLNNRKININRPIDSKTIELIITIELTVLSTRTNTFPKDSTIMSFTLEATRFIFIRIADDSWFISMGRVSSRIPFLIPNF